MPQRIRRSRRKISRLIRLISALTVASAVITTIGISEGLGYIKRSNIYEGTKNVASDVSRWLGECYETGYINDIKRRADQ